MSVTHKRMKHGAFHWTELSSIFWTECMMLAYQCINMFWKPIIAHHGGDKILSQKGGIGVELLLIFQELPWQ